MGVEADAPLRRGSRIKRPAARYVPEAESTDTRAAGRKRVHTETREDTKRAKSSTDDEEEEEEDDDDEEDDSEYCICRRGNDGSPMICCNRCGEWFHFRCVGLSKRAAEQMQEYVCQACKGTQSKDTDYEEEGGVSEEEDESDEAPLPPPRKTRTSPRTPAEDHPVRQHVLTTFTSILEPLYAAKKLEVEAAHTYAHELEAELFHAHGQDVALRAYKERFRSLAFNLKDQRNVSLHERITSGQLPAQDMVHLSNEALANDSIRQATEKAKRQALEQAILHEHADGPARKITHKGEVDIEREQGDARPAPEPAPEPPKAMVSETAPETAPETTPATAPETAPEPDNDETPCPTTSSEGVKEDETAQPPEPISFTDVWHTAPKAAPTDTEVDAVSDLDDTEALPEADTCIDSFLGDSAEPSSTTPPGTPPPDAFVVRATQKATVSLQPVVWDGVVTMPEYTSAYVHVRQLTQPAFVPEAPIWQDFFPAQERIIEGRLPSQTAIDYLGQVRLSPRNDIVVLVMDAGGAASSDTSTLHSSPALDKLVHYFADKERFGVLTPAPGAQGSLVKDFYLAPLLSHMPVPDWLKDIHPDGLGEAWDAQRPANILLVVLVLFKTGLEGRTAPPAAPPSAPPGPPPSLDAILNVKPDAIQNLLSTLNGGGGASPQVAAPAPGPPPPMPTSLLPPGPPPIPPGPPVAPPGPPPPQPMRPWGGVVRNSVLPPPAYGPVSPAYGGAGSGTPHPFPVGPGGWYGGHADRVKDKSRRRRNGGGRR